MTRGFCVSERTVLHRRAVLFLLFATLLVNKVAMAQIQQEDPCRYRLPHYEERWSCVSGVSHVPDYLDRLKYLVLGEETYVSFGAEIRETYERFRNPNFGLQPQDLDGYLLQRYLFHSEVRVRKSVRVYVELLSALENGRAGGPRPVVDEDRLDFHQGFVDIDLDIGQNRHAVLRFGRQGMALGSGRLIALREARSSVSGFPGLLDVKNPTIHLLKKRNSTDRVGHRNHQARFPTVSNGGYPFLTLLNLSSGPSIEAQIPIDPQSCGCSERKQVHRFLAGGPCDTS